MIIHEDYFIDSSKGLDIKIKQDPLCLRVEKASGQNASEMFITDDPIRCT